MKIQYQPPQFFYRKQQQIYDCKSLYTVVLSANKTGKSLSLSCWLNEQAILGGEGKRYCWLSPFSKTSTIGFELIKIIIMGTKIYKHLREINHPEQFKFYNSFPQKIIYPNGAIIDFVSGLNIDSLWGQQYDAAVVDEAARLKQKIIEVDGRQIYTCPAFDALKTNLRITKGAIKLISNPTTKNNWFYIWYKKILKGEDSRASAFHLSAEDSVVAGFLSKEDLEYARNNESDYIFQRDWMGVVPVTECSVFRADRVYECIDDEIKQNLAKVDYLGVDVGFTDNNKSDWTVVSGLDRNGELKFFRRFRAEGDKLINKLKAYINNRKAYIDATSGGYVIYSLLIKDCPNLEPVKFNNTNKCSIIETLAHYIHTQKIKYPNIDVMINELLGYESETKPNGTVTYNNGKNVQNDDSVISLALATLKYKEDNDSGNDYTYNVYDLSETNENERGHWKNINENYFFDYNIGQI